MREGWRRWEGEREWGEKGRRKFGGRGEEGRRERTKKQEE